MVYLNREFDTQMYNYSFFNLLGLEGRCYADANEIIFSEHPTP